MKAGRALQSLGGRLCKSARDLVTELSGAWLTQVISPPPGQKTLVGFLQAGGGRIDPDPPGAARSAEEQLGGGGGGKADGAGDGAVNSDLDPNPDPTTATGQPAADRDSGAAAATASAYFSVAVHALGARTSEGRSNSRGGAEDMDYPKVKPDPGALAPGEAGEWPDSQAIMPSLRDWAGSAGAPAGGSGLRSAAQDAGLGSGPGDQSESVKGGQPDGYFPLEAEWEAGAPDEGEEDDEDEGGRLGWTGEPGLAGGGDHRGENRGGPLGWAGDLGACEAAADRSAGDGLPYPRDLNDGGDEEEEYGPLGAHAAPVAERATAAGRGPPGVPGAERGALARWQCLVCTFAGNRGGVLRCALCDTLKGSRAWQPPRAGTLSRALADPAAAAPAAPPDLLSGALKQEQGCCDRVGLRLASSGGKSAPLVVAASASGGAGPATSGVEQPGTSTGGAAEALGAGAALESGGGAALPRGAAEGVGNPETQKPSAKPDWEPVAGPEGSAWRCRRCGEVVGDREPDTGSGSVVLTGVASRQTRAEHDDYHIALAMQRAESLDGAPGVRSGSGPGCERRPAAVQAPGAGRGANGRKRRASGNPTPRPRGVRSGRGTMDAFLQRADARQS